MPTKRRLKWPDLRWLAAGLCALLLAWPAAAAPAKAGKPAANKAMPGKAVVRKTAGKPLRAPRKAASESSPPPLPASDSASFFGAASFYGYGFQGRLVANGERFDVRGMTAACNRVPLGTWVAVRREDDGRCIIVRVNDRMHVKHKVRVIDLSRGAAEKLRMISAGVVMVRVAPLPRPPQAMNPETCLAAFGAVPEDVCQDCDSANPSPQLPTISGNEGEAGD